MDSYLTLRGDIQALSVGAIGTTGEVIWRFFEDMRRDITVLQGSLHQLGDEVVVNINTHSIDVGIDKVSMLRSSIASVGSGVMLDDIEQVGTVDILASASRHGSPYTPAHRQMIDIGLGQLQPMSGLSGEDLAVLLQKLQEGTITVDMLKQAMVGAASEGKSFSDVLGSIKDVAGGVKDGIDGFTKLLELTGKFSGTEGGAELVRSMKNVSGVLDSGLKLVSGTEGVVGGISELAGIGEVSGSVALANGTAAAVEAVTGFELLTTAATGAVEGLGLISTALLATPWGAAAVGIAGITAGLYTFYEHEADLKKSGEEWATQNEIKQQMEDEEYRLKSIDRHLRIGAKSKEGEYIGLDESDRIVLEDAYSIIVRDKKVAQSGLTMDHFVEMLIADKELARYVFIDGYNKSGHLMFQQVDKAIERDDRKKSIEKIFSKSALSHTDNIRTGNSNLITGGGGKQIVIHVKSFAEHFTVNANNLPEAGKQSREVFERMFLEVLHSANAAM